MYYSNPSKRKWIEMDRNGFILFVLNPDFESISIQLKFPIKVFLNPFFNPHKRIKTKQSLFFSIQKNMQTIYSF